MRVTDLILPEVREALQAGETAAITELVEELHPADVADIYKSLTPDEQGVFLRALPMKEQVQLIEELEAGVSAQIVEASEPEVAAKIVEGMSADERADLFRELPQPLAQQLLAAMPKEEARDVKTLLAWPEGTVGSLMTTDFVALPAELTAHQAIERIRQVAEQMETIYYAYAVSPEGALRGVVSLRDLVTAKQDQPIAEVMESEHLITLRPESDREEAARTISKYDFLAVPVLDDAGHVLGIVTVDDVVDVVQEEATEDVQKMAGITPLEESYFRSSFFRVVRSRAGWLVLLFVGGFFTTHALQAYQDAFSVEKILVIFIPLIISSGGNTGSQSAGLLIRAMALGEVVPGQWWRVLVRELASGLFLGAVLGGIGLGWAGMGMEASLRVSMVVGFAVMSVVLWGSMVGALMPMLIRRAGLDPAVASAPMIATMSDVAGIVIYMSVARLLLGLT
jgi:magnesium transporter